MSNSYKRILTIQDISCVGQCSLTVALPILSACGLETAVLPSAVLSTHTAGFTGFTCRDLTDDMPAIAAHWQREGLRFAGIYTGYLGSTRQVGIVEDIFRTAADAACVTVVDPAMADNGKLYPAFDQEYVEAMKGLCARADYILPNLTEACLLTDTPYTAVCDRRSIDALTEKLLALGCRNVALTGVSFTPGKTGVLLRGAAGEAHYEHTLLANGCHGTGDIYASAFVGALLRGKDAADAIRIAADYVLACIGYTTELPDHWYGAAFEPLLPTLIRTLEA